MGEKRESSTLRKPALKTPPHRPQEKRTGQVLSPLLRRKRRSLPKPGFKLE